MRPTIGCALVFSQALYIVKIRVLFLANLWIKTKKTKITIAYGQYAENSLKI